ncbi:hypothetical protein THMIRHAS_09750 [Thiosulfatimonas sediminis]|uniref:HPt domain-containing protein n=1 Tax=Thiosulfatimonas sediminis TaxID=2675054 RepID=A0A6F8PTY6_9GAMM|nr:hypothetical protein [Thiosulfatimonas sediminis]BBP45602.1 hypothetical protein THMIRHAS_09750 [Thiosulfatimonas sediminis]
MIGNRTQEIIDAIGITNFIELYTLFNATWPVEIKKLQHTNERKLALHKLKGNCYSVGLDLIGKHIESVEDILDHGAESTAREHFSLLIKEIELEQDNIKQLIARY